MNKSLVEKSSIEPTGSLPEAGTRDDLARNSCDGSTVSRQFKDKSPGECPIKTPLRIVVDNAVPLPTLVKYFRAELRMSKRDAQWMAREVYRDEAASRAHLPEAWHTDIWPAEVAFIRRRPGISDPTPRDAIRNITEAAA